MYNSKTFSPELGSASQRRGRAFYHETPMSEQHASTPFTIVAYSLIRAFIDDGSR